MNAIRIRRKLDSETLHRSELKPLIDKTVELVIQEERAPVIVPGTGDWQAAARAAQGLRESGYDFDTWQEQRDYDLRHARDHLP